MPFISAGALAWGLAAGSYSAQEALGLGPAAGCRIGAPGALRARIGALVGRIGRWGRVLGRLGRCAIVRNAFFLLNVPSNGALRPP